MALIDTRSAGTLLKTLSYTVAVLTLFGCTSQQSVDASYAPEALVALEDWRIEAKLGIRTQKEAHSAYLRWHFSQGDYDAQLFGPFGKGKVFIEKQGRRITLTDNDKQQHSHSAEALFQRITGYKVPIDNLLSWIKGIPVPTTRADDLVFDELGRLTGLQQDGWQISYDRFVNVDSLWLPTKIVMRDSQHKVTLIVKKWQAGPTATH